LESRPSLLFYCQLAHDAVTGWADYVKKHYTLRWRRQSGGSSDSSDNDEEVPAGRGRFPQPYAFQPTSATVSDGHQLLT